MFGRVVFTGRDGSYGYSARYWTVVTYHFVTVGGSWRSAVVWYRHGQPGTARAIVRPATADAPGYEALADLREQTGLRVDDWQVNQEVQRLIDERRALAGVA